MEQHLRCSLCIHCPQTCYVYIQQVNIQQVKTRQAVTRHLKLDSLEDNESNRLVKPAHVNGRVQLHGVCPVWQWSEHTNDLQHKHATYASELLAIQNYN